MSEETEIPVFGEDGWYTEAINGTRIYDGKTGVEKGMTNAPTVVPKLYRLPDDHGIEHVNRNPDGSPSAMSGLRETTYPGQFNFKIEVNGRTYFTGRRTLPAHIQVAPNVWVFAETWEWEDSDAG